MFGHFQSGSFAVGCRLVSVIANASAAGPGCFEDVHIAVADQQEGNSHRQQLGREKKTK